ncbi:MAG: response regulator [Sedimentisphaerales bacterium]
MSVEVIVMSKTIMVVDDSASLRQVVSIALKGAGYDVLEAGDGQEALGLLDGRKVNLIISDVNMPNMDGISMVTEVKKNPSYKFTPIIMLTTESQNDMKQKGKEAGVKAWVVKPFKPEQMLDAVSKLVM